MTEHLKPCPFCKSDGEIVRDNLHMMRGYIVKCSSCGAETMYYKNKKLAVDAWNTRPLESENKRLTKADGDFFVVYCTSCGIAKAKFYFESDEDKEQTRRVCEISEDAQAAEIARLRGNIEAIKKIVDKRPLSIYDAAQIYAECCDALKDGDK